MDKLGSTKIDLDQLLDEVDRNKDGVIDYEGSLNSLKMFVNVRTSKARVSLTSLLVVLQEMLGPPRPWVS